MIKDLYKRAAKINQASSQKRPTFLPAQVRRVLRQLTGGGEYPFRFLRGLFWRERLPVLIALFSNLSSTFFEIFSLSLFFVAIQVITSGPEIVENGLIQGLITQYETFFQIDDPASLFLALVLTAIVGQIMRSGLQLLGNISFAFAIGRMDRAIRNDLVSHYFSISYPEMSTQKIGDLAVYPAQIDNLGRMVSFINKLIVDVLLLAAYFVYLFWLSWEISLVGIGLFLLVSFGLRYVRQKLKNVSGRQLGTIVQYQDLITEFLQGIRTIHVFERFRYVRNYMRPVIQDAALARRSVLIWTAVSRPLVELFGVIGIGLILLQGYRNYLTVGESIIPILATYLAVLSRLLPRMATLNSLAGQIARQWPYVVRLANFLERENKTFVPVEGRSLSKFDHGISFENVSFSYPGSDVTTLKNLTFELRKGESVAIVGPSGSGKSTIVNLLLRLYKIDQGQIKVDGFNLEEIGLYDLRSMFGVVDQDTFVFNDTVTNNIRFGLLDADQAAIETAAKGANAHEFILALPDLYETVIGNRGQRLSGGQRQRLAIARALVRQPAVLIFDEATSALDSHVENMIQRTVKELKRDRTILMIAHRLSTIAWADKILLLDAGEIVASGTHHELLKKSPLYNSLWMAQADV